MDRGVPGRGRRKGEVDLQKSLGRGSYTKDLICLKVRILPRFHHIGNINKMIDGIHTNIRNKQNT